jgi:dTDP-4-dehydrorhamnose 3,5-epimerase
MQFERTGLEGLVLVMPRAHGDARGFFMETWRRDLMEKAGLKAEFVQDNQARSERAGVLRGLHFQKPDQAQAKYIGAIRGVIFDVAVDLRAGSKTFGQWRSFILSEENKHRLFVPRGFAHGYLTLEPGSEVLYKTDAPYAPGLEGGIIWNDPDLGINWPIAAPQLSEKDKTLPRLRDLLSPFP